MRKFVPLLGLVNVVVVEPRWIPSRNSLVAVPDLQIAKWCQVFNARDADEVIAVLELMYQEGVPDTMSILKPPKTPCPYDSAL